MSASANGTAKRETILAVDDNAPNRLLAEAILSSAGYDVQLAESGQQAIEMFQASPPRLVLLDILMPGMDGFETLKRLRALPGGGATPIMIVTALTDLMTVQKAIELGADDFVAKPLNRTELLARIWSLLGARRSREARLAGLDESAFVDQQRAGITSLLVHDLKHPLTTIYFTAGLLVRDPALPSRMQEKIRRVLRASETLDHMIMSLLDVTCSEDGALRLNVTDFEVRALLAEVLSTMEPQAEANRQTIELVQKVLETMHVQGDRDLLRRMLENLIDNSTKYAPPESTIRLEVSGGDGCLEFRVRDEGPGIPLGHRHNVFHKYFQLEPEAHPGRRGRGLGLTMVRVAAEAHRGTVWIEDQPKGSCFCVRIPQGARATVS
jgi:two-component system, sensor histidine kinase and response regulator